MQIQALAKGIVWTTLALFIVYPTAQAQHRCAADAAEGMFANDRPPDTQDLEVTDFAVITRGNPNKCPIRLGRLKDVELVTGSRKHTFWMRIQGAHRFFNRETAAQIFVRLYTKGGGIFGKERTIYLSEKLTPQKMDAEYHANNVFDWRAGFEFGPVRNSGEHIIVIGSRRLQRPKIIETMGCNVLAECTCITADLCGVAVQFVDK